MNELVLGDDLGPRGRRRVAIATAVSLVAIVVAALLAVKRFHDKGQLDGKLWESIKRGRPLDAWRGNYWRLLRNTVTRRMAQRKSVLCLRKATSPTWSSSTPGLARIFLAGRGITAPEKGRTEVPFWITTPEEGRKAVQENAAKKVDIIKIWVDDRDGKFPKLTPPLYSAVIDEAMDRFMPKSASAATRALAEAVALERAKSGDVSMCRA